MQPDTDIFVSLYGLDFGREWMHDILKWSTNGPHVHPVPLIHGLTLDWIRIFSLDNPWIRGTG